MAEKISLGFMMSNKWGDAGLVIIGGFIAVPAAHLFVGAACYTIGGVKAVLPGMLALLATLWAVYKFWFLNDGPAPIDDYVKFEDEETRKAWSGRRIPITTLCALYLHGHVTFKGDCLEVLSTHRNKFVNYKIDGDQLRWLLCQLFPNSLNSSMKDLMSTKKEIAEHYDRGNDWFESFLGPRMVYTSGVFEGLDQNLETAQDNKMSLLCDKLMLKKDEKILDIGCGWGTLCRHAAKKYEAHAIGVTLSVEGAKYCREAAKAQNLSSKVDFMCMDYRQIPQDMKFDKIVSVEMAEHVGLKNFQLYLTSVRDMLKDDGMFLMQVAGLRQGANWEDVAWGLFMSRYIFPGADASTPLHWYVWQLEKAGFEVHSVETIGRHYAHTLHKWYDNFQKNRPKMEKTYGGYLCRLWDFFLAWSVVAAGQGTGTCYQILVHKNKNTFDRDIFCSKEVAGKSVGMVGPSLKERGQ